MFAAGCSKPQFSESMMPSESLSCSGQIIKNKYIVRYKNGETVSYAFDDREKFKTEVVEPVIDTIDYIEFDQVFKVDPPAADANSSYTAQALDNWGLSRINAQYAWQQGVTGVGVTVAVVDSGVDINHSQLQNQIAYNQGEIGTDSRGRDKRFNGVDDDGNGQIDDYAGFDFANNKAAMVDEVQHGTHVAGIIAAQHNDSFVRNDKVQGLAPGAKVLPVKFIGATAGSLDGAIKSLEYARKMKVKIVNASWGGPGCSKALSDKIRDVTNDGIIFAVAAGNSGANLDVAPEFPAAYRHSLQVTVGSSGMADGMSSFSNYSRTLVNIFAPGFNIFSTLPNNQIGAESGTSMATPYVAAALALLWSSRPAATAEEVISAMYASVVKNTDYMNSTEGRLDVAGALARLQSTQRP